MATLKRPDSLGRQLLLWLLLPLALLLGVNAFLSHRTADRTADQAFNALLAASADTIADQLTVSRGRVAVDIPYVALQLLESPLNERIYYRVLDPAGQTISGFKDLPPPPARASLAVAQTTYTVIYRGETLHMLAYFKQVYGLDTTEPVLILVGETGESRNALAREILAADLERQALLIVAAGLLVWLGLRRGLKPLASLRASLLARSPNDLSPIDPSPVQAELRPLIEALNQHTQRIDQLIASRQRFIADASHQLRTPLAEMRTQVEYTLRQNTPAASHETLTAVRQWIDSQTRLIGQLLMTARAEPDAMQQQGLAPIDLAGVAREAATELIPAARRKAIDLSFEDPGQTVTVNGNALLLHEMAANLIDNAVRYTPARGAITVRVLAPGVEGLHAALEVEDDGPGIPPAERERVFERFYRGGGGQDSMGSGLGLSIVRDICASHGAVLSLESPRGGGAGLRVRVVFGVSGPEATSLPAPAS
jgi:two-component system, OmpR family, sensor histidine kinase TctE